MAKATLKSRVHLSLSGAEARVIKALVSNVAQCDAAYAICSALSNLSWDWDNYTFDDLFVIEKHEEGFWIVPKDGAE